MSSSVNYSSSQNKESVVSDDPQLVVGFAEDQDEEDTISSNNETCSQKGSLMVTSHLYLKPAHTSASLDKQVILRRIRHRKRVNQVRAAVQSFLGSSSSFKPPAHKSRWSVDDPFAAP